MPVCLESGLVRPRGGTSALSKRLGLWAGIVPFLRHVEGELLLRSQNSALDTKRALLTHIQRSHRQSS
jgi:hypothetical protein